MADGGIGTPDTLKSAMMSAIAELEDAPIEGLQDPVTAGAIIALMSHVNYALDRLGVIQARLGEYEKSIVARVYGAVEAEFGVRIKQFEELVLEARGPSKLVRTHRDKDGNLQAVVSEPGEDGGIFHRLAALEQRLARAESRGLEYKGLHTSGAIYRRGDAVTFKGNLYICTEDNPPSEPLTTSSWQLAVKAR